MYNTCVKKGQRILAKLPPLDFFYYKYLKRRLFYRIEIGVPICAS